MTTLDTLYFGDICPCEKEVEPGSDIAQWLVYLVTAESRLTENISEEQNELFEKYKAIDNDLASLTECERFKEGFKLGARLMMEVLKEKE